MARRVKKAAEATGVQEVEVEVTSFTSPESSTIYGASYDPSTETLKITFTSNLSTYRYEKIPLALWVDFVTAESKGKFVGSRIRPFFTGTKEE